jgi:hypothetical protein
MITKVSKVNKKVATIVLNRNLPSITDKLCESIILENENLTDVFVVESGSDKDNYSKYCSWSADWEDAQRNGLRYPRGFNYGLLKLIEDGIYENYDYIFFVCNNVSFESKNFLRTLVAEIESQPQLGILSPCNKDWGEKVLINENNTKYFWHVQLYSWIVRTKFIDDVIDKSTPNYVDLLFDGNNFRGYCVDLETVVKGYANDWATGITTKVYLNHDDSILRNKSDLMKTDCFDINKSKYYEEGLAWLRKKYGFNSRWSMQLYSKFFYENFFKNNPQLIKYKI